MKSHIEILQDRIAEVLKSTQPKTKERNKALAQIKWRMRCGLLYLGLDGLNLALVTAENATVYDGRDNEAVKLKFAAVMMNPNKFEVELCG